MDCYVIELGGRLFGPVLGSAEADAFVKREFGGGNAYTIRPLGWTGWSNAEQAVVLPRVTASTALEILEDQLGADCEPACDCVLHDLRAAIAGEVPA